MTPEEATRNESPVEEFARVATRCLSEALAAMNDAVKLCATDGPGKAIEYIADYLNNTDGIDVEYARVCPDDWLTRWDVRLLLADEP